MHFRELAVIVLAAMLFSSAMFFTNIQQAKCDVGKAKVYIISLPDVGTAWVDNRSSAVQGAIAAVSVYGKSQYDCWCVPAIHVKYGSARAKIGANRGKSSTRISLWIHIHLMKDIMI
jgi:hypothetical protein